MGITYDAPSNAITVTGYTEEVPCTFEDIYQADVAGGWGVVSKQSSVQYAFDAFLRFGDYGPTETYFEDSNKQIVFNDGIRTGTGQNIIYVFNNAQVIFGTLEDESQKRTSRGVSFIDLEDSLWGQLIKPQSDSAIVYLYSCQLFANYSSMFQAQRIWNCLYGKGSYPNFINLTIGDINNVIGTGAGTGFRRPKPGITINNLFLIRTPIVLWFQNYAATIRNTWIADMSGNYIKLENTGANDHYLIDVIWRDVWNFSWTGTNTGKIYRQYTFNLKVVDSDGTVLSGVTVKLYDKDENEVFSVATGGDGKIAEQTVSRGYYAQATGDTLQDYGPFVLELTKTGYKPLTVEVIVLADPVDWVLELLAWSEVLTDVGDSVDMEIPDESLDMDIPDEMLEMEVVE